MIFLTTFVDETLCLSMRGNSKTGGGPRAWIPFQAFNRFRKTGFILLIEDFCQRERGFFIRLQPDLLESLGKTSFFFFGNVGQNVSHQMDLAPLPGSPDPFLSQRCLDVGVSIGDAECVFWVMSTVDFDLCRPPILV